MNEWKEKKDGRIVAEDHETQLEMACACARISHKGWDLRLDRFERDLIRQLANQFMDGAAGPCSRRSLSGKQRNFVVRVFEKANVEPPFAETPLYSYVHGKGWV